MDAQSLIYLLESIKTETVCNGHYDFLEWKSETEELKNCLEKIGKLSIKPSENQFDIQYWGKNAPIQLEKYPYYACNIFQCKKCQSLFFYYREIGGHWPQDRYRLIQKELITF